jgi:tetratricopeptide (TPR) repeat protein
MNYMTRSPSAVPTATDPGLPGDPDPGPNRHASAPAGSPEVPEPASTDSRPGPALRALLMRANLTPEELARELSQLAAGLGLDRRLDPKTPYKWFRGAVPRHPWPALTAHLLANRLGTAVSIEDLGWSASGPAGLSFLPADTDLALPWTVEGAVIAASRVSDLRNPDRAFLPVSGTALIAAALQWLTSPPAGDPARVVGRHVGLEEAADFADITARLRQMHDRHGSGLVLPQAQSHARLLAGILRDSSYTADSGLQLHAASAELHRLTGCLHHDSEHPALAQRYWLAGLHAAHAASDRAVGANILAGMSRQASAAGQPAQAIQLARAAQHGHPGASPHAAAIISFAVAQAHASAGDATACEEAIGAARELLANASPGIPVPDWADWLDDAAASAQAGTAYLYLRDWANAQDCLTAALRGLDPARARETAAARAQLALSYAGHGDPERACDAAAEAVTILTTSVDSARCVGYLRQLNEALRPYGSHPAVAAHASQAEALLGHR